MAHRVAHNVLGIAEGGDFQHLPAGRPAGVDAENQYLIHHPPRRICGALNRRFCQTAVMCWRSVCRAVSVHCLLLSLVRWLGGSFGFFSVGLSVGKKYKCATKCVG